MIFQIRPFASGFFGGSSFRVPFVVSGGLWLVSGSAEGVSFGAGYCFAGIVVCFCLRCYRERSVNEGVKNEGVNTLAGERGR